MSSIAAKSTSNHTTLYHYATNFLAYHVRSAVPVPLAPDGLAASLLFHDDPSVTAQALAGLHGPDLDELANHYLQAGSESGYWCASRLYYSIASMVAGLGRDATCSYYKRSLAAVKHVATRSQSGALTLQCLSQTKLIWYNRSEGEVAEVRICYYSLFV
jgi:hypothetical protein